MYTCMRFPSCMTTILLQVANEKLVAYVGGDGVPGPGEGAERPNDRDR